MQRVHGGEQRALGLRGVLFFFFPADLPAKIHERNNERKRGAGEPYCKPDFHV